MVAYELSIILKTMSKANMIQAVKRTTDTIASQRGLIEKIEFLGTRDLPYRLSKHGHSHSRGSYFLIHYHAPFTSLPIIKDNCNRDLDIIRPRATTKEVPEKLVCSLHHDTLPPAYRTEVKTMMAEAEKRLPKNIKMRTKQRKSLENYKF